MAEALKLAASAAIECSTTELVALGSQIWQNPEFNYEEYQAHELLTGYLEKEGFAVQRSYANLETAFRATFGQGRPNLCVICEYDALPGLGHACGHNLIAEVGVAVGLGVKAAMEACGGGEGGVVSLEQTVCDSRVGDAVPGMSKKEGRAALNVAAPYPELLEASTVVRAEKDGTAQEAPSLVSNNTLSMPRKEEGGAAQEAPSLVSNDTLSMPRREEGGASQEAPSLASNDTLSMPRREECGAAQEAPFLTSNDTLSMPRREEGGAAQEAPFLTSNDTLSMPRREEGGAAQEAPFLASNDTLSMPRREEGGATQEAPSLALKGTITILGTPGEEGGGGKVLLMRNGAFEDMDLVMMAHPAPATIIRPLFSAVKELRVEYKGQVADSASEPWEGKNALDAAVLAYNSIALLRQQLNPSFRVHLVIVKGGEDPSTVPERSLVSCYVKAPNAEELNILETKVRNCFHSAALSTACTVSIKQMNYIHDDIQHNPVLAEIFSHNFKNLGAKFEDEMEMYGSTDMVKVSRRVPTLYPYFAVGTGQVNHSAEFAGVCNTAAAHSRALLVARALAHTCVDVLTTEGLVDRVQQSFEQQLKL